MAVSVVALFIVVKTNERISVVLLIHLHLIALIYMCVCVCVCVCVGVCVSVCVCVCMWVLLTFLIRLSVIRTKASTNYGEAVSLILLMHNILSCFRRCVPL